MGVIHLRHNEAFGSRLKKDILKHKYIYLMAIPVAAYFIIFHYVPMYGVITSILTLFGMEKQNMIGNPSFFWGIYVGSGIWQDFGWGSIIYLAAISGVDPNLYEASILDGAGKWKQIIHITIPSILPTIIVLFILRMGSVLGVGAEKVLPIYSEATWETSDIISTYVYRKGLIDSNYSYSAAVGLFNSVVNLILLITFNKIRSKVSDTGLW